MIETKKAKDDSMTLSNREYVDPFHAAPANRSNGTRTSANSCELFREYSAKPYRRDVSAPSRGDPALYCLTFGSAPVPGMTNRKTEKTTGHLSVEATFCSQQLGNSRPIFS